VRAAVAAAARLTPALPLFAGGKSFGARMTSQAQAEAPLPDVRGLAFLGFPLHPAGKPSADRAQHLFDVRVPMLFLQGTRDALADLRLLVPLAEELGQGATLSLAEDGDHSFHVRARSGRTDEQALARIIHRTARNRPRPPNTWARNFIAKNFIKQPIRIVVSDINGLALIAHFS